MFFPSLSVLKLLSGTTSGSDANSPFHGECRTTSFATTFERPRKFGFAFLRPSLAVFCASRGDKPGRFSLRFFAVVGFEVEDFALEEDDARFLAARCNARAAFKRSTVDCEAIFGADFTVDGFVFGANAS